MCYIAGKPVENAGAGEHNQALALLTRMWAQFFVVAGLSITLLAGRGLIAASSREAAANTAVQEQVLASTIQIDLFDKGRVINKVKYGRVAHGLGTLVAHDGQQYIMTHNHWPLSETDLERVELRDAAGRLLVVVSGSTFVSLVRYHDAGTLLLAAPPQFSGVTPAPLGDSANLTVGDSLWIVTRDKQQGNILQVKEARVERAGAAGMPGQLRLRGSKTAVAKGDSGGGVWHEGKLVGNMWAIVRTLQNTPWAWQGWFSSPSEMQPSGAYIMARQPLAETGLAAGEKMAGSFKDKVIERAALR